MKKFLYAKKYFSQLPIFNFSEIAHEIKKKSISSNFWPKIRTSICYYEWDGLVWYGITIWYEIGYALFFKCFFSVSLVGYSKENFEKFTKYFILILYKFFFPKRSKLKNSASWGRFRQLWNDDVNRFVSTLHNVWMWDFWRFFDGELR